MSTIIDYNCRQLVPRLLSSDTANHLLLNVNSNKPLLQEPTSFESYDHFELISAWRREKSIPIATQILAYESLFANIPADQSVVLYLDEHFSKLNLIEREILHLANIKNKIYTTNFCEESFPDAQAMIRDIRLSQNSYQRNPFLWCDLGYFYTKLGMIEKAEKAYMVAISLNSSNRFIVRSVSRFYIHIGRLDVAHHLLVSSPSIFRDPGILSAEIALAEIMGIRSKFINKGIGIISRLEKSTPESNELFAQIATLEFSSGKKSKGRNLVERSLDNLTENSLAQLHYLSKFYRIDGNITNKNFYVPCQYEALTRSNITLLNCREAARNAKSWHNFQPFSSVPALYFSFLSSMVFEDHQASIEVLKSSLICSPDNIALLNNLAYAYAQINQLEDAQKMITAINANKATKDDQAIILATQGLISFKYGHIDDACNSYENAVSFFRSTKNYRLLALALFNYALVLSEIDLESGEQKKREAHELISQLNDPELNCILQNPKAVLI